MRVVGSRVFHVGGPISGAAFSGSEALGERRGVYLELRSDDGRSGWGEASPLAGFHAESLEEVSSSLFGVHERVGHLDLMNDSIDVISECTHSFAEGITAFSVETALVDLAGQARKMDVAGILGGAGTRASCRLSSFVGKLGAAEAVVEARHAVERGIDAIKLKAQAADLENEIAAIAELTRTLPASVEIRLDLNGALSLERARVVLDAYGREGVSLVEEPARGRTLLELGGRGAPWFADESLVDGDLAERLLDERACRGFVIKPALLGLFEARRLALRALEAGKGVIVTHMFDGPISLAAACELALSLPRDPLASGLEAHAALTAYPRCALPQIEHSSRAAEARRTGRAGLGLAPMELR